MNYQSDKYKNIIAQAWTGMLLLLFLMLFTDLIEGGIHGDFSFLAKDPGVSGLWFIVVVACINLSLQLIIKTFNNRIIRRFVFVMSISYTLIFIAHQTNHLIAGEAFDYHTVLDLTHHVFGIWGSIAAYKWLKC